MNKNFTLSELGWRPALQQQLSFEELELGYAARVDAVHRDRLHVLTEQGAKQLLMIGILNADHSEARVTTGDWLWLENETDRPLKIFDRLNLLKRTSAGSKANTQLIAANIDTIFIVSSCNQDFNVARLERYLSLVMAAHIPSVIVLTKADLTDDVQAYVERAQALHRNVPVLSVNALAPTLSEDFSEWLLPGQTVAFIGSSGVGKSTLTNSLLGQSVQATDGIREDDAKGRHTTTNRSMHQALTGAWVMDTPGMRELRLNDDTDGVVELFDDIEVLAQQCRFSNCHHHGDKGCAIELAISEGRLEERRWLSYQKLLHEAEQASLTKEARRKAREQWGKDISRLTRQIKKSKRER